MCLSSSRIFLHPVLTLWAATATFGNDVPVREPKDGKLQGAADAIHWTTLDIRKP